MKDKAFRMIKWMMVVAFVLAGSVLPVKTVKGVNLSMGVNATTVYVGEPIVVTVYAKGLAGPLTLSGTHESTIWVDDDSYTLQAIYPSAPGTYYVSASGVLADFATATDKDYSTGVTIQVLSRNTVEEYSPEEDKVVVEQPVEENKVELSSISTLDSLSLSVGKLEPAFSSKVKDYKVKLEADVTSLKLNASPSDKKAKIKGDGEIKLHVGDNKINVTCTAEDGTKTVYTIHANVDDQPLVFVNYKDKKLGVSRYSKELTKKLFEKTTIKVGGKDTQAWVNKELNMTLLYLEDKDEKDFYFYDPKKEEVTSIYRPMALAGENVAMVDVPTNLQNREGMVFGTVEVDGKKLPGWTYKDKAFSNYVQIYVMNDAGDYVYYQYEKTKESMQLFDGKVALSQAEYDKQKQEYQKELHKYEMISVGCGIAIVALLGVISFLFVKKRKSKEVQK